MRVANINGPSAARVKSTKRFVGCETVSDMKARLTPKETIAVYTYGIRAGMTEDEKKALGRRQVEVRTVRFGRMVIVATAEPVAE